MVAEAATLDDPFASDVRAICLTPQGGHGAASLRAGATYHVMTASSDDVETWHAEPA